MFKYNSADNSDPHKVSVRRGAGGSLVIQDSYRHDLWSNIYVITIPAKHVAAFVAKCQKSAEKRSK